MELGEKQLKLREGRTKVFVLVSMPQKPGLLSSKGVTLHRALTSIDGKF